MIDETSGSVKPAGQNAPDRLLHQTMGTSRCMLRETAPTVTVAICTHNRIADVRTCCRALAPQTKRVGFKSIIVDSGSEPSEARQLFDLAEQYGMQYLRIDRPGLSRARNLACRHAETEWVAFLDDDAIPEPDWAESLHIVLSNLPEEVALVGGRIVPLWPEGKTTSHITDRWKLLLSCIEAEGSGLVECGNNVCGANLSVRCDAVNRAGGFADSLGRTGTRLLSGEESLLIERLADLDLWAAYDSSFVVRHRIDPERLSGSWAAKRAYWEGISRVVVLRELGRPLPWDLSVPRLIASIPILAALILILPDARIRLSMAIGSLVERWNSRPVPHRKFDLAAPRGRAASRWRGGRT